MVNSNEDPLVYVPPEKWVDIQEEFKRDWPRGVSAYWALENQKEWLKQGIEYEFKVYCPFGDPKNGMVAANYRKKCFELIIQCPNDDTTKLEDAIRRTKVIDMTQEVTVPFPPVHIIKLNKSLKLQHGNDHELFLLDRSTPLYKDTGLPDDITFGLLTQDHADQADLSWINKYDGSKWIIQKFIEAKSGFGLFKDKQLVCFVFINEVGAITHLYVAEDHRQKGYAQILLKLVCNTRLIENKDVFGYCKVGNESAAKLYCKLGMKKCHIVNWHWGKFEF